MKSVHRILGWYHTVAFLILKLRTVMNSSQNLITTRAHSEQRNWTFSLIRPWTSEVSSLLIPSWCCSLVIHWKYKEESKFHKYRTHIPPFNTFLTVGRKRYKTTHNVVKSYLSNLIFINNITISLEELHTDS